MISISYCYCQAHDEIHRALVGAEAVRNHYASSKSWKGAASVPKPAREIDLFQFYMWQKLSPKLQSKLQTEVGMEPIVGARPFLLKSKGERSREGWHLTPPGLYDLISPVLMTEALRCSPRESNPPIHGLPGCNPAFEHLLHPLCSFYSALLCWELRWGA